MGFLAEHLVAAPGRIKDKEQEEIVGMRHSLLWLLGIAVLTALVFILGGEELKKILFQADPFVMGVLFLVQLGTLAAAAWKWHYLLGKLVRELSFTKIFTLFLAGNFVESVTPSVKFGGEAARIYLLRRYTALSYGKLTGVLFTHKYISLLPLVLLAAVFLGMAALRYELPVVVYFSFLGLGAFFILVAWLARGKQLLADDSPGIGPEECYVQDDQRDKCRGGLFLWKLIHVVRAKGGKLLAFLQEASRHSSNLTGPSERKALMLLSLLVWFIYPLKVYLVSFMLGYEIGLVTAGIITYAAYLVSMFPLLPGGFGSFEGSMVFMFSLAGFSPAEGLAVALLTRLVTYWFPLLLSAVAVGNLFLKRNLFSAGKAQASPELLIR